MDATVNARVAPIISGKGPNSDLAPGNALVAGHKLREFEIVETLGEGGFSIVYGARDVQLLRDVAIKEYIPISLAGRVASTTVRIRSEHNRETFEAGLNGFINEARLLAQFKHPGLVEVLQFWEENGTAYMVMPRYTGKTLRSVLKDMGGRGDEPWLRGIVAPVLDVLELLHSRNVFHRDIAPDNILIKSDGTPVLLDLGSAREVVTGLQKAITVVVKPGYAPIEQYSSDFALPQGPWTDVYAVGALLHFAIVGTPPPASISRIMKDSFQPLAAGGLSGYSREFLSAVDRALALQPGDRPQSIPELRELLRVTEHDKTVIALAVPEPIVVAEPPLAAPEPVVVSAASVPLSAPVAGGEEDRTVIVSAQELSALVQQLASAKAAAAAQAAAGAAALSAAASAAPAAAEPVPAPPPVLPAADAPALAEAVPDTMPFVAPAPLTVPPPFAPDITVALPPELPLADVEIAAPPLAAALPPLPEAPPASVIEAAADTAPVPPGPLAQAALAETVIPESALPEPLALQPLALEPVVLELAAPEPVAPESAAPVAAQAEPPAFAIPATAAAPVDTPARHAAPLILPPASVPELTLEPMVMPESAVPATAEPVVVSEFRFEAAVIPPAAPDTDATVVMPAPRALVEAAKAQAEARSAPPPSDATVVMAKPDALELARRLAAAAPAAAAEPAAPAARAAPVPAYELDPLAAAPRVEKPQTNSFPEMEDLMSGRLASEARPVAVPAAPPKPAAAAAAAARRAAPAAGAVRRPSNPRWIVPVCVAAAVLIVAGVAWFLLSRPSLVPIPPPIVEVPAAPPADSGTAVVPAAEPAPPVGGTAPDLAAAGTTDATGSTAGDTAAGAASSIAPDAGAVPPAAEAAAAPLADAGSAIQPIAVPNETTSPAFEGAGQTLPPPAPPPVVELPAQAPPVAAASPAADTVKTVDVSGASTRSESRGEESARPRDTASARSRRDAAKPALATTGNVKLSIQPWGEVWVNGSLKGVSPPMRFLQLEPGTYSIELRNPGLQSSRRQLTVVAGQPTSLEHRFQPSGDGAAK